MVKYAIVLPLICRDLDDTHYETRAIIYALIEKTDKKSCIVEECIGHWITGLCKAAYSCHACENLIVITMMKLLKGQ